MTTEKNPILLIEFESTDRGAWLRQIAASYQTVQEYKEGYVSLKFALSISVRTLKPFHLVTIASLIHHCYQKGLVVTIQTDNDEVFKYIYEELSFYEYWSGGKNYVETRSTHNVLNLWRIVEQEKDLYAKRVEMYFRERYFQNKDLSAVSVCLLEAYYNVFDHAQAEGNAFSLIQYDEASCKLFVAISDFGKGIAKTVRDFDSSITSDKEAILKALEDQFTVGSTKRNRGFGLSNILSPTEEARIFSHRGLVYKKGAEVNSFETDFSYPGTLIYFEINLSNMDDEEFIEEFSLQ